MNGPACRVSFHGQTGRTLDLDGLTRVDPESADRSRRVPVVRYGAEDLDEVLARAGGVVLTDDYAPVENLIEPLLR